jgi:hypothetical protein
LGKDDLADRLRHRRKGESGDDKRQKKGKPHFGKFTSVLSHPIVYRVRQELIYGR